MHGSVTSKACHARTLLAGRSRAGVDPGLSWSCPYHQAEGHVRSVRHVACMLQKGLGPRRCGQQKLPVGELLAGISPPACVIRMVYPRQVTRAACEGLSV